MEKEIKNALFGGNNDQVVTEGFRLTITRKDVMTLHSLNWLNDEVGFVNVSLCLISERQSPFLYSAIHHSYCGYFGNDRHLYFSCIDNGYSDTRDMLIFSH